LLIKWKDYPKGEASWKREIDFQKDYPSFVIEDNDKFFRGGLYYDLVTIFDR